VPGPQGPAGAQGLEGVQGPQGISENANVRQYTYGGWDFSSGFLRLLVTTTLDTMNNSAWLAYAQEPTNGWWFSFPGPGYGGGSIYRMILFHDNVRVNIMLERTGPGEMYQAFRVVRIYIPVTTPGGKQAWKPPVDLNLNDYEAVKRYYNLPD
jgi:hypothetical protein